jgi:hypothetical protein
MLDIPSFSQRVQKYKKICSIFMLMPILRTKNKGIFLMD